VAAAAGITVQFNNPVKPDTLLVNPTGPALGAHNIPDDIVITPGVNGVPFTVMHLALLVPHPLVAVTHTCPVTNPDPGMVELTLFPPAVILAGVDPVGNVQLKVAPACGGQPNDDSCAHKPVVFGAVIDAGTVGRPMPIDFDRNVLVTPQVLV
jgi:hypothetical protein